MAGQRGGYVHRIAKDQTISDAAFSQAFLNLGRDIDKSSAGRDFKPQLLPVTSHIVLLLRCFTFEALVLAITLTVFFI